GQIYHETALRYGVNATPEETEKRFREVWLQRDGMVSLVSHSDEKVEKDWWRNLVAEVFQVFGTFTDFEAFFEELCEIFGRPDRWRTYPEVEDVLGRVKASGKKAAVISNWDSRLFQLVQGLGLEGYFEFVLASAVFGSSKPNPKIFLEGLHRLNLQPSEAVHIGDSLEDDVQGARASGVDAIFIDRHQEQDPQRQYPKELLIIHSLDDIF
ncbi:HAD-IA family hydrolase, partial [Omnitrophica bacterium]|nr:HAD-IA family hydrolase [Candidatus Omnitrophota bacterium]